MNVMGRRTPRETGAEAFGRRLRELRKSRGWTLAQLAEKLAIHASIVGNYERGLHYPPIPTLVKLGRVLDVSLDRLLGEDERKMDEIQDRGLYQLFLEADRIDFAKQGLVKQVLASLIRGTPAVGKSRTGTSG